MSDNTDPLPRTNTDPLREEWIDLATDIRAVDGNHSLGAGALAEALTERGWTRAALHVTDTLDVERWHRAFAAADIAGADRVLVEYTRLTRGRP